MTGVWLRPGDEDLEEVEIDVDNIGELVMEALLTLDKVAYIRFASVYKNFRETKDFEDFITGELGVEDD